MENITFYTHLSLDLQIVENFVGKISALGMSEFKTAKDAFP